MKPVPLENSSSTQINVIGISLCLAGAAVLYFAGICPALRQEEAVTAQNAQLQVQRQEAVKLAAQAAAMRGQLAEMCQRLSESEIQLRPVSHLNRQIARLAELASGNGLKMEEVEPGKVSATPQHLLVPIRMSGRGSYENWSAFLGQLPNSAPDTHVESFELTGNPHEQSSPATFQVGLVWYAMP